MKKLGVMAAVVLLVGLVSLEVAGDSGGVSSPRGRASIYTYQILGANVSTYTDTTEEGHGYYATSRRYDDGIMTSDTLTISGTGGVAKDGQLRWTVEWSHEVLEGDTVSRVAPIEGGQFLTFSPSSTVEGPFTTVSYSLELVYHCAVVGYTESVSISGQLHNPLTVGLSYAPDDPSVEDTIVLTAMAAAPDAEPLSYAWFLNGAPWGEGNYTESWENPSAGTHTVEVVVTDDKGRQAYDSITFTVDEELAVVLSYTPEHPTPEDTIIFTAEVTVPDKDALAYVWYLNDELTGATSDTVGWPNPSAGTHTVRVVVSDAEGRQAEDSVTFTVQEAVDEELAVELSYTPEHPTPEDTIKFTTEVTAPDEATLTYTWFINDVRRDEVTGPVVRVGNPPVGTHTVRVVVSDAEGRQAEDSVTFTVEEAFAVELSYSPEDPTTEDIISFATEVTAPDGATLTYTWFINDVRRDEVTGPTVRVGNPPVGTHTVRVVVSDAEGREAEDSVTFTVEEALAVELSYSPEDPTTEDTMVFTTEVTAPDDATLTYAWFINDELTGATGPSFTWDNPPLGTHAVEVVVSDDEGREAAASVTFTVEEALAVELSYSPEDPTTEDAMVFTTEVTAPSGVSLTYSWFINGVLLPDVASHGATWDEPSAGTHIVRVVVSDDEGRQAEDSVTFTVEETVLNEITIGLLTIRADSIVKTGDETWTASGNVSINEFLRTNAVLHLDMEKLEVRGSGRVYIPSVRMGPGYVWTIDLFEGSFELEADLAQLADAIGVATKFEVGGLSFELKKLKIIASGVEVEGELELPPWAYGLKVSAGVTITTHSGIQLDEGKIEIPKINLGGGYEIKDAYLEYKTENDLPIWGGGGGVSVPNLFTLEGSLELKDGSISKVSIGLDDLNVVIGTLPVFLQKIHASLEGVDPHAENVKLTGTLGFTGGPRVAGKHAIGAELSASIDGAGKLEGTGKITLISDEGEIAGGSVALDPGTYVPGVGLRDASLSISGTLDILGILVAEGSAAVGTENNLRGRFTGSLQTPDDWRLIGGRQFSGLDAWLSNDQFAMSVSVWRFGVIVAYAPEGRESWATWGSWHIGCNLEEIEQEHAMPLALGAVETSFAIPPDTPFGVFQLTWEQGDADFYIVGPDGAEITEAVAEANPDDYLFERHAGDRLAFFAVNEPQPGSWQIVVSNAEDIGAFAPTALGGVEEDPSVDYEPPTVPTIEPHETTATPGWTFFGLPVETEETDFEALEFDPDPTDVHMFWWDPDAEAYEGRHELELHAMRGYWLFVTHDHHQYQVSAEGTQLAGDQELELGALGWQMISVPYPVAWGDAEGGSIRVRLGEEEKTLQEAIDAMWLHHTLSAWDADGEEWTSLRATDGATLVPWTGYYLFVHQDDLVLLYSEEEQGQALWDAGQALSPAALSFDPGEPPLPPMLAEPSEGLVAVAYPNPVADDGGVTFTVRGSAARWVEAIRVRVHDLSGRLVYEDESAGASLLWDTMGPTGAPVASGVYLYTVQAELADDWVSAGVDRLLILR